MEEDLSKYLVSIYYSRQNDGQLITIDNLLVGDYFVLHNSHDDDRVPRNALREVKAIESTSNFVEVVYLDNLKNVHTRAYRRQMLVYIFKK